MLQSQPSEFLVGDERPSSCICRPTLPANERPLGRLTPWTNTCVRGSKRCEDLSLRVATGRGGEREDGRIAQLCPNLSQPAVIWPEILEKLKALFTRHREPA
jgi:hypothetical protein